MLSKLTTRRALYSLGILAAGYGAFNRRHLVTLFSQISGFQIRHIKPGFVVDVSDFGTVGDGVTNDAPSLNRAIGHLRSMIVKKGAFLISPTLKFPPGIYLVDSAIDLTRIRAINLLIEGSGAVILASCKGQPAIDAMGSRWLSLRNLTIIGDQQQSPSTGIQIGRSTSDENSDNHQFDNVRIVGYFSLTSFYNRGAETSSFNHCFFWNDSPASHCLIQDGLNHFNVKSNFVICSIPTSTSMSFNENIFVNCDLRHGSEGIPTWLGDTSRHSFIRCYSATGGDAAFIVYSGEVGNTDLQVDCHCETAEMKYIFILRGGASNIVVAGMSFRDHLCFARSSIFIVDGPQVVKIENFDLNVTRFRNINCKLLLGAARWHAWGRITTMFWPGLGDGEGFSGILEQGEARSTL